MRWTQRVVAGAVIALLGLASFGVYWTGRERTQTPEAASKASADLPSKLDERSVETALQLVYLPTTADEIAFAQEALHRADVEMDLAYADAVRDATAHPKQMSKKAQVFEERFLRAEQERQADSALVAQLSAAVEKGTTTATKAQLGLAKLRLEADVDAVDEARDDFIQAGGNTESRLDAMLKEHQEGSRRSDSTRIKVTAQIDESGLVQTAQALSVLHSKEVQLRLAMAAADSASRSLAEQRGKLDADAAANPESKTAVPLVEAQRRALDQRARLLTEKRAHNQRNLASAYSRWLRVVRTQERGLMHRILGDLVLIFAIVLILVLIDAMLVRGLNALDMKRRSAQRLRVVTRFSLQVLGILLIFIVIFGAPHNLGTILGLAGAGLTVALKDFIVSFVGWLLLMGKHGIRVGDLVEINNVTGEVVELGIFNTVLHETGNWTDSDHPTGRRVTFTNSYAVEGHYFNFSTSGQWLWDEVRIDVPVGKDPYPVIEALQKQVEEVTAENARLAEKEWTGVHRSPGVSTITAAPAITIKPVMGGVEVTLRYITHAAERYEVRSKLYQTAVGLLGDVRHEVQMTNAPS
jgi:small-conductance mechanosensitive channel